MREWNGAFREMLERELRILGEEFPELTFRFCRVMGRRVSHVAGDVGNPDPDELRLPLAPDLLLAVGGAWRGVEEKLRGAVGKVADRLMNGELS